MYSICPPEYAFIRVLYSVNVRMEQLWFLLQIVVISKQL